MTKARAGVVVLVAAILALPIGTASPAGASVCDPACQAVAALDNLRSATYQLIPEQLVNSFIVKIDAAEASVESSRFNAALNKVEALGNELDAAGRSGLVSETLLDYGLLVGIAIQAILINL